MTPKKTAAAGLPRLPQEYVKTLYAFGTPEASCSSALLPKATWALPFTACLQAEPTARADTHCLDFHTGKCKLNPEPNWICPQKPELNVTRLQPQPTQEKSTNTPRSIELAISCVRAEVAHSGRSPARATPEHSLYHQSKHRLFSVPAVPSHLPVPSSFSYNEALSVQGSYTLTNSGHRGRGHWPQALHSHTGCGHPSLALHLGFRSQLRSQLAVAKTVVGEYVAEPGKPCCETPAAATVLCKDLLTIGFDSAPQGRSELSLGIGTGLPTHPCSGCLLC